MKTILYHLSRFNSSTIRWLYVYENLACLKWDDRRRRTLGDTKLRFENSKGKGILIHSTFRHSERLLISSVSRLPSRFSLLPRSKSKKRRIFLFLSLLSLCLSLFRFLFLPGQHIRRGGGSTFQNVCKRPKHPAHPNTVHPAEKS